LIAASGAIPLLLVEDEEKIARFIVRSLLAERFVVGVAAEVYEGLEPARNYNYDLIIPHFRISRPRLINISFLFVAAPGAFY